MKALEKKAITDYMENHNFPSEIIKEFAKTPISIKYQNNEEKYLSIKTLEFQSEKSTAAGNINYGIRETLKSLKQTPNKIIKKVFFRCEKWGGILFTEKYSNKIIGIAIAKSTAKTMATPPNWDGSIEALQRFNKES